MYPSKTDAYPAELAMGIPAPPGGGQTPPPQAPQQWSTGLCDCFDDGSNCFITCCCPCITFGQIAEIVDRGTTSCGVHGALYTIIALLSGCQCIYSCVYRKKLRALYNLPESPCPDFFVHCCCEACALCQDYRELKNRGFDMNLGWHGNMERQGQQGIAMTQPPTTQGGMHR